MIKLNEPKGLFRTFLQEHVFVTCLPTRETFSFESCRVLLKQKFGILRDVPFHEAMTQHSSPLNRAVLLVDGEIPLNRSLLDAFLDHHGSKRIAICSENWKFLVLKDCFAAGARNFFLLPCDLMSLAEFLAPPPRLVKAFSESQQINDEELPIDLSQEKYLARRLLDGWTVKEISRELGVSIRKTHLIKSNLFKRFGCSNKGELLREKRFQEFATNSRSTGL